MPRPKEQSNFTDPDSRIMKSSHGWIQGYNAQVLVEAGSGVIVAQDDAPERRQPQIGPYAGALGPKPGRYRSPGNRAVSPVIHGRCGILQRTQSGYARRNRRLRSHGSGETLDGIGQLKGQDAALRHAVQADRRLKDGRCMHVARSSLSRSTLTKHVRGFRQFLLRGIHKVAGEFTLVSLTHNLLKLWRANPVAAGSQTRPETPNPVQQAPFGGPERG